MIHHLADETAARKRAEKATEDLREFAYKGTRHTDHAKGLLAELRVVVARLATLPTATTPRN